MLVNITGGLDMTLFEVDEAANRIREEVDPDANIIFGSTFDETLEGQMRISVVATGIDRRGLTRSRGRRSAWSASREPAPRRRCARPTAGGDTAAGADAECRPQPPAAAARAEAEAEPAPPAAASGRERGRRAAAPSSRRSRPTPGRRAPDAADPAGGPGRRRRRATPRPSPKAAVPSLIERVTGVGRAAAARRAAAAAACSRSAPARQPAQPRLGLARAGATGRRAQGRGPARHPGLPAPPGELTGDRHAAGFADRASARCGGPRQRVGFVQVY